MTALARTAGTLNGWASRAGRHARGYALNPLLMRELRVYRRGRRLGLLQIGYLVLTAVAMVLGAYVCRLERASYAAAGLTDLPSYGFYMFVAIFETQVVMLALLTIAYSAGAISLEYERRTFDMLAVTTLTSLEIVAGKVLSVVVLCATLLLTSLPLAAICMLLGNLSPGQLLVSYGLLLCSLPLWATLCVLISTLLPRSVTCYVVGMVAMAALLLGLTFLSVPDPGTPVCIGILNPMLTILTDEYARTLPPVAYAFAVWGSPPLLYALFTALGLVAAAEALPQHRPRRSTALRLLFLACFFSVSVPVYLWLLHASTLRGGTMLTGATAEGLWVNFAEGLVVAWVFALAAVPVVCSYLPPREAYTRPLGWFLERVPWRRWFARESNVGWRCALVFYSVGVLSAALPLAAGRLLGAIPGPIDWSRAPHAVFAVLLYALSVFGYACWCTSLTLLLRQRRAAGALIILIFGVLNALPMTYENDPWSFHRARVLAHPVVLTTSPASAADHALQYSDGIFWGKAWRNPWYTLVLPVLYQVVFAGGGLAYVRRAARKGEAELPEGNQDAA